MPSDQMFQNELYREQQYHQQFPRRLSSYQSDRQPRQMPMQLRNQTYRSTRSHSAQNNLYFHNSNKGFYF